MASGIDFLSSKRKAGLEKVKLIRLVNTISIVVLVGYCLVAVASFSYWLFLQRQTRIVNSEIELKKQRITQLQEIESLQLLLKQRLSVIDNLFSQSQIDYQEVFNFFNQAIPSGVNVTGIALSSDNQISVSGIADNGVVLSSFLEGLTGQDLPIGPFDAVVLSSTSRSASGFYEFSLILKNNEES